MDSVARGTFVNLATRLLGVALVLAITAVAARIGPQVQGAFALFTSVEGVLLALCSGFGVALARQVSQHAAPPGGAPDGNWPRGLIAATVLACAALGVLAALVLLALAQWGPQGYRSLWLLALAAPLLLQAPNLQGLWLGAGRMGPMARLALAPPLLALLLLGLLLALQGPQLGAVLLSWVLAKAAVGAALLWWLWRRGLWAAPDGRALHAQARFVATIGVTNLIALLNYRVGLFVVERLLGLTATGVYSIAVVVAELLWFVSGSLTQAAYGRIGAPERAQAAALTVRVMQLGVAALVLAAPLLWLSAWLLLPRLLGATYAASLLPLALLLPGVLLFGAAGSLSAWFTNQAGRPQVPAQVAALSLLLNAGLALALVPRLGSAGAALAASLAYAFSVAVLALRFARHAAVPLRRLLWPQPQLWADLRGVASRAMPWGRTCLMPLLRAWLQAAWRALVGPRMLYGWRRGDGVWLAHTRISSATRIESPRLLQIDDHVYVGPFNLLDASGGLHIGEGVQVTTHCALLTHSSHQALRLAGRSYFGDAAPPGFVRRPTQIGAYSFIGPHSVVMPGSRIGRGVLVKAYSYVDGDLPDFAVAAGQPAVVVGDTRELDAAWLAEHPQLRHAYDAWAAPR